MSELSKKIKAAGIKLVQPTWVRRPEILLCNNVPKMMHGVAPRVVLGQKWWDQTRKAAYASTSFHCLACGVWKYDAQYRSWLEGHEIYDINYQLGRMIYVETVALCVCCHGYIHDGRLRALLDQGKITHQKYAAILQHGERVLKEAGLSRMAYNERDKHLWLNGLAEWGSWRLIINVVIDGKRVRRIVRPKYKNFEEWQAAMAQMEDT